MRIRPACGTSPGVEHFWMCVERLTNNDGDAELGYFGPFTLDGAMEIAWRVRSWTIAVALAYVPGTSYLANGTYDVNVGGATLVEHDNVGVNTYTVGDGFIDEKDHLCGIHLAGFSAVNTAAGSNTTLSVQIASQTSQSIIQVAAEGSANPFADFFYGVRIQFGDGVGAGVPFTTAFRNYEDSGFGVSGTATFRGNTQDLYPTNADVALTGTLTITPKTWWAFARPDNSQPLWNTATGSALVANPAIYAPSR